MDATLLIRIILTITFFLCLAFLPLLYLIMRKLYKTLSLLLEETKRKNFLTDQNHQLKNELEHYRELLKKDKSK